jgi:hypothetical protein
MKVEDAPQEIQELFDRMLSQLAIRNGCKDAQHFIDDVLGGVVYHFTLNFLAGHTLTHADEYKFDGPGLWIWNLILQTAGLFYLLDRFPRKDGSKVGLHGVQLQKGDCTGFTNEARTFLQHGVFRDGPINALPTTKEEMEADPGYKSTLRIVATLRGGDLTPKMEKEYDEHFAKDAEPEEVEEPEKPLPTKTTAAAQGKRRLRANLKVGRTLRATTPKPTKVPKAPTSTALVSADFAYLPQKGDVLNGDAKHKYGSCTVLGVHSNFVRTDEVLAQNAIPMREGVVVSLKLATLDDRVLQLRVVSVGEIWGKAGSNSKYRSAIIRRKWAHEKEWGELETLEAAGWPDVDHCMVIQTYAYTPDNHILIVSVIFMCMCGCR